MKKIILLILFGLTYLNLSAQEASRENANFKNLLTCNIGLGYYEVTMDNASGDNSYNHEMAQTGIKLEYARKIGNFLPAFGYEIIITPTFNQKNYEDVQKTSFLAPYVALKYLLTDNFFLGTSVSYRKGSASRSIDEFRDENYDSESDIWASAHAGFLFTTSEKTFYTAELRAGFNLTNNLWGKGEEKWTDDDVSYSNLKNENISSHDIILYFGIGAFF